MIELDKVLAAVEHALPNFGPTGAVDLQWVRNRDSNAGRLVYAIIYAVVEAVNAELRATAAALESGDPAMLEQAECLLMARFGERLKEQSA